MCECCGDARRVVLVRRELPQATDEYGHPSDFVTVTLCGSCSVVLGRQRITLDALRAELQRYAKAS
jgi:biopolymer transport protein ExbD